MAKPKLPKHGVTVLKGFRAAMRKQLKAIGRERDKLRDLVEEGEAVLNSYEDAAADIERAIDTMSELV